MYNTVCQSEQHRGQLINIPEVTERQIGWGAQGDRLVGAQGEEADESTTLFDLAVQCTGRPVPRATAGCARATAGALTALARCTIG